MTLYSDPSKMLNALQGFIKKHLMDLSSLLCPLQLPYKKMNFVRMLQGRYTVPCYSQMFEESRRFILDPMRPPTH